ncbi:hypothetical protein F5Y06DRAFT_306190 [Hypoxylon sp. FL0890]|nr:hypothetical protein F5Y06DRAFT_306190 [Hypoxylon sp. FL0890]
MGAAISAIYEEASAADEQERQKARQDLEVLQKAVAYKLNQFEDKLRERFLNPDSVAKTQVPGLRALRISRYSNVGIKGAPEENVSGAIDNYLGTAKTGFSSEASLKDGFKKIVSTAMKDILSTTAAGEHEQEAFFVYVQHNSVIRLDVMLWRWNFTGNGFSDKYENVLGYVICTSIVDVSALKTAEFVYLISEYAGDSEEEVLKYIETMGRIYSYARKLKQSQRALPPPEPEKDDD